MECDKAGYSFVTVGLIIEHMCLFSTCEPLKYKPLNMSLLVLH